MINQTLKIPVIILMMILGAGLTIILFAFLVIGLLGGSVKEMFFYISSSQVTTPTTFNESPVNVLITQD